MILGGDRISYSSLEQPEIYYVVPASLDNTRMPVPRTPECYEYRRATHIGFYKAI